MKSLGLVQIVGAGAQIASGTANTAVVVENHQNRMPSSQTGVLTNNLRININGLNGHGELINFQRISTLFKITLNGSQITTDQSKKLKNGDILKMYNKKYGAAAPGLNYIVRDLKVLDISPKWPKRLSEMNLKSEDHFFTYSEINNDIYNANKYITYYKATIKPEFNDYLKMTGTGIKAFYKEDSVVKLVANKTNIINTDGSTSFKSSFGTMNHGYMQEHVDADMVTLPGLSGDISKTDLYVPMSPSGESLKFLSNSANNIDIDIINKRNIKRTYRNVKTSGGENIIRNQGGSGWFSSLISVVDPFEALVDVLGGAGMAIGGNLEWSKNFFGYGDQTSTAFKAIQLTTSITSTLVTLVVPGLGEAELAKLGFSIERLNSLTKSIKLATVSKKALLIEKSLKFFKAIDFLKSSVELAHFTDEAAHGRLDLETFSKLTMKLALHAVDLAKTLPLYAQYEKEAIENLLSEMESAKEMGDNILEFQKSISEYETNGSILHLDLADPIHIEPGDKIKMHYDFHWKIGAAFHSSFFHWFSHTYGTMSSNANEVVSSLSLKNIYGGFQIKDSEQSHE